MLRFKSGLEIQNSLQKGDLSWFASNCKLLKYKFLSLFLSRCSAKVSLRSIKRLRRYYKNGNRHFNFSCAVTVYSKSILMPLSLLFEYWKILWRGILLTCRVILLTCRVGLFVSFFSFRMKKKKSKKEIKMERIKWILEF